MLTDDGEASRKSSSRAPAALFWILRLVGGGDAGDEDGQESVQELIFRSSSISAALNPGTGARRMGGGRGTVPARRGIVQVLGEETGGGVGVKLWAPAQCSFSLEFGLF
jgi:hypothetical protein